MRLKWLIAAGLVTVGGCATCQECRSIEPTPQHAAPPPPRAPEPVPEEELPPLPVPTPTTPQPRKETGRIVRTTRTETEGASVYVEVNAPGSVVVGSPGASAGAPLVATSATVPTTAQAQAYPLIPVPVPDSMILAAARRVGRAAYVLATGDCPPPRAQRFEALMPVQETRYARVPVAMAPMSMQMVPTTYAAPMPVAAPQPQAMATPQAPHKWGWFGR